MALRSLLRKMTALGLRSPAGPHMGPVHAPSPVAASRRMFSSARPKKYKDSDPRLNELFELMDKKHEMHKKAFIEGKEIRRKSWDKLDKDTKALAYGMHCLSVLVVLAEYMKRCA